jgi:DnaD/phage-associated family protein
MAWVPVPAPLLGGLLADIDDPGELKLVLRILWHIHQKKGAPRPVEPSELYSDRVIADALGLKGEALEITIDNALKAAVERGIFIRAETPQGEALFILNIQPERAALASTSDLAAVTQRGPKSETWNSPDDRPGVYVLYEQNIGPLTPLIAERLREAAETYPSDWIGEAIKIAVENNVRNWKYVSAILERWQTEGRVDGQPRRDPEEARQAGYRKAFEKYVRDG